MVRWVGGLEHCLYGLELLNVFAATALRQGGCGKLVRNLNKERQAAAEGYLPVEDANGLRGSQAEFPKNPFCFLFYVRFNARVDDWSFHDPIVSHSQHRCKMFLGVDFDLLWHLTTNPLKANSLSDFSEFPIGDQTKTGHAATSIRQVPTKSRKGSSGSAVFR
jgi:hypothetical protein